MACGERAFEELQTGELEPATFDLLLRLDHDRRLLAKAPKKTGQGRNSAAARCGWSRAALTGSSAGREGRVVAVTNGGALAGPGPRRYDPWQTVYERFARWSGTGLGRGRSSTSRRRGGVDGVAGPIKVTWVKPLDAALAIGPDRLNGRHHHGHTVNRSRGPVSRERDGFGV